MTYLMSQHRGQLRLIVQISQQSAVDIDIAPWSGKGVNVRAVDNSKGKGAVDYYVCSVKPGTVMFEIDGVDKEVAKEAMDLAAYKLPVKCKFVTKD